MLVLIAIATRCASQWSMEHVFPYTPAMDFRNFHVASIYVVSELEGKIINTKKKIIVTRNGSCEKQNFSQVCGKDGKTYDSLCLMYRAGYLLAYTGPCRPLCKGEVCGMDKNTYPSACHARAHNTKVDYSGKCFSKKLVATDL